MSEKRRDNKGRVLRNGESQRKDGRFMYKYTDNAGNIKYVYSWKLVKTDTVPKGVKDDLSLREKEKLIHRDLEDDISPLWRRNDSLGLGEEVCITENRSET